MKTGYIYKLICSKTSKVYYGSSFNIKRHYKGWYKCSCKDFVKPIYEIIETLENTTKDELLLRENYYICNNECVNNNVAKRTSITDKMYHKDYRVKHKEQITKSQSKYDDKLKMIFVNCPECNKCLNIRSLKSHQSSPACLKFKNKNN